MVIILCFHITQRKNLFSALIITKAFRLNLCMVLKLEFYKILMDLKIILFFCILFGLPQLVSLWLSDFGAETYFSLAGSLPHPHLYLLCLSIRLLSFLKAVLSFNCFPLCLVFPSVSNVVHIVNTLSFGILLSPEII